MRFHSIEVRQVRQATIPHQSSQRLEKPRSIPLDATEAARGPTPGAPSSGAARAIGTQARAARKSRGAATIYLGAAS